MVRKTVRIVTIEKKMEEKSLNLSKLRILTVFFNDK